MQLLKNIRRSSEYNDKAAVEPLIRVIKGEAKAIGWDEELRAKAAYVLGDLEDQRAVVPLIEVLTNDEFAQGRIALCLGN